MAVSNECMLLAQNIQLSMLIEARNVESSNNKLQYLLSIVQIFKAAIILHLLIERREEIFVRK